MDPRQEEELIRLAKRDPEAFGQLYEHYYSTIFNYILRRTASIPVAQDITSEVFFKALKNLQQFRWCGIPFSAWLYRVANHEISNHYRRNGHHPLPIEAISESVDLARPDIGDEIAEAEAQLERHEHFLTLQRSIRKLPVKYQEVITLRFFEDKQIKEISAILGKSEGTVKSLLHRGLARLRVLTE